MFWQRNLLAAAVLVLGIAGFAGQGHAQTSSDTFQVSAQVNATCSIVANDLSFGTYDPTGPDVNVATNLEVTCTNGAGYEIGLDGGTTANDVNNRAMGGPGADVLNYALYRDPGRNQNWGNTAGNTVTGTGTGATEIVQVYGELLNNQFVQSGLYTDNVVATIDF